MVKTGKPCFADGKPSVDLQRIALLTAISVVSKRLAERYAKLERQNQRKGGGASYDPGQSNITG